MDIYALDKLMAQLDATDLRALADWHDYHARLCRDRATELDTRERDRNQAGLAVQRAFSSPALVAQHIAAGMTLDQAFAATARATGHPVLTIEHHWRRHLRETADEAREARNRLILTLAQRGLGNRDIAQRTGLHEVSVSRILSRLLGRSA